VGVKDAIIKPMTEEKLENIRHSLAHLLAAAVLELWPDTKNTIGPAIDNGFYYDFEFASPISDKNLLKIEKRMKKMLKTWKAFESKEVSQKEAKNFYKDNPYKQELIDEITSKGENITLYTSGNFTDLCRGGHAENMKEIDPEAFKLSHVAGAYWRGDENNIMLTRIYGLAFETKKELEEYEERLEEAKKRDHRKLGKELDLFTFSDLVGSGLPLFTPKGTLLRNLIADKIQSIQEPYGYQRVWIPHIAKRRLYEISGHWEKFKEDLFHVKGKGDTEFVMKPMNCPHHTQIYASKQRSYRDLPIRFMEITTNYRDEQPGELLGLTRVRSLTQDDGHVFCTLEQVKGETKIIISVIREFYESLDMFNEEDYWVSLSVRDKNNLDKYLGHPEHWDQAETILEEIAKEEKLNYKRIEGEAAFYGPKLDFMFKDTLGREWQLATIQLDFVMPERFKLEYTDKDNSKKTPIMIHRAIAGSLERFLSIIIEHFAGAFPLWLSPVQVAILPIAEDKHGDYAQEITETLRGKGIRIELKDESVSLGKRIREAKLQKIPYLIVIGDEEIKSKTVTVEAREDERHPNISIDEFITLLQDKIENKSQ